MTADTPILSADPVTAGDGEPREWLYVLHGVYGAGRNWATVVRRLVGSRPEWGGLLVDLREHGDSRGFPPPHTLDAAAEDLRALAESRGKWPAAVLGHSFGGKVALSYARSAPPGLRQVWVVDSTPEAAEPSGSAWRMLEILREIQGPFDSRDGVIARLEERGVKPQTARWMATNLERAGGKLRWRFDLDAIEELMRDFYGTELWDVLESPPDDVVVHMIKAEESGILDAPAVERIERTEGAGDRVRLHRVEGGHWLNVDNPDALVDLLGTEL